jgi:hypothetical protein
MPVCFISETVYLISIKFWCRGSTPSVVGRIYEGRFKSLWTRLITASRNFVEVQWRSLFRSTSHGKRCTSYNAPPTSRNRVADHRSLRNFLPYQFSITFKIIFQTLGINNWLDNWGMIPDKIFLFACTSRPVLRPTQPFLLNMYWRLSPGLKQPDHVTTHLHLTLRLRMHEAIPPLPHMSSWCGA